jgi:hypothetical protein
MVFEGVAGMATLSMIADTKSVNKQGKNRITWVKKEEEGDEGEKA